MIRDADLVRAPSRLSDLSGDALRHALFARHEAARARWRAEHERAGQPAFARLMEMLRG